MAIASGVFKKVVLVKQANLGATPAAGDVTAKYQRRVTSTLAKKKANYTSNEIDPSMQDNDMRHGVISVDGSLSGELSVGTYSEELGSVMRQAWAAIVTTGATGVFTLAAAPTTGAFGTFTRAAGSGSVGSFFTNGFKKGMVVRSTGWASPATANNAHNFIITALTATVMTGYMLDAVAVVVRAAGDTVTITSAGKSNHVPQESHTSDYWTIEHYHADLVKSEKYTDVVFTGANIKLPATGMATIDFPLLGINMTAADAAYFTTVTAASTGTVLAAVNGAVFVQGLKVATITSLDISITGGYAAAAATVGSNVSSSIVPGKVKATGNMSVQFDSTTLRDYFLAETEVEIIAAFTGSSAANADFISLIMPRCKINDASISDGEGELTMSMPFVALNNKAGGAGTATFASTIAIQDSLAA